MDVVMNERQHRELMRRYRDGYNAISILITLQTLCFVLAVLILIGGVLLGIVAIEWTNLGIGMAVIGVAICLGAFFFMVRILAVGFLQIARAAIDTAVFSCTALTHDMRMEIMGLRAVQSEPER